MSDGKQKPVAVIGIKPDDPSKPPCRLELREMRSKNPDQFNLFLLGMERFMDPSKEQDPLSYYQIAGIHGRPFYKWPNYPWNKEGQSGGDPVSNPNKGYCTHSSVLFLSWHRPYLAIFEQALYKHVNDIAREYGADERRDAYVQAAKTFRFPYWDWAGQTSEDVTLFPIEVWTQTKLPVVRPGSKGVAKPLTYNPLSGYRFGQLGKSDDGGRINPFNIVNATLRQPDRNQGSRATSSDEAVVQSMLKLFKEGKDWGSGKNLTERMYFILTSYTKYGPMCTNIYDEDEQQGWSQFGSAEDVHNSVHDYVGGGGHMGSIQLSAFDPIFWLHHNNIDRMMAIWQAVHSDAAAQATYCKPSSRSGGTRIIPPGGKQSSTTPLVPFNKSERIGDYWNSDDVKDTKVFGYVYPETQNWVYPTKEAIVARLQQLYPVAGLAALTLQTGARLEKTNKILQSRATLHKLVAETPLDTPMMLQAVQTNFQFPAEVEQKAAAIDLPLERKFTDLIGKDHKYLEWLINIKAEKHTLDGDYVVHFFLGPPEDERPELYVFNPNHVAAFTTLGRSREEATGCEKCREDQANHLQVTGQIPLTLALVERYYSGQVNGLTIEQVEPYLAANLHWRVTSRSGERLHRRDVAQLLIGVVTNEVTIPRDGGLPIYSDQVIPRPAATTKQGTVDSDEPLGRGDGTGYTGGPLNFGQ